MTTIAKPSLLEAPAIPAHLIDSCNSKVWAIAWETAIKEALRKALQAEPLYTTQPSVEALKEELQVTEQNLADCMAELHAYDCKVDALIAEIDEAILNRPEQHRWVVFDIKAIVDKYRSAK
jgi:hypothetical protein